MNKIHFYIGILLLSFLFSCKEIRKEYYPDGTLKVEQTLKNGKLNGVVRWYYPNGQIEEESYWVNNKLDGIVKSYYEDGSLMQEIPYKNGLVNGFYKFFYKKNRNLKAIINHKDSIANGLFIYFYTDNKVKEFGYCKNDSIIFSITYDSIGNFIEEYRECKIEYSNDTLSLGDEFFIKFKIAGKLYKNDTILINFGSYNVSNNIKIPTQIYTKTLSPIFKFKPSITGKWEICGGVFLLRKIKGKTKIVWRKYPVCHKIFVKE